MDDSRFMSAVEAARRLGIQVATLYAYVSRGLIRSEAGEGNDRARRYHREDVEALKAQRETLKDPIKTIRRALDWGTPILESALTLIRDGRLFYRGHDATVLASTRSFEEVVSLLWLDDFDSMSSLAGLRELGRISRNPRGYLRALSDAGQELPLPSVMQTALSVAGAQDLSAYDLSLENVAAAGARILTLLAAVVVSDAVRNGPSGYRGARGIAGLLAAGWRLDSARVPLLNAALTLCADHELNVSAFASRVVASSGAQPYQVVLAGLAALQGFRHGGSTARAEEMLRELLSGRSKAALVRRHLADRMRRGEAIPGFGHALYADGDPRARFLLDRLHEAVGDNRAAEVSAQVREIMRGEVSREPNLDFALASLSAALELPAGSSFSLFAVGRAAGWIGHAIEEYARKKLIRPRASYTGRVPK